MLLLVRDEVELLVGLGSIQLLKLLVPSQVRVELELLQRLLLGGPLQLLRHHVAVLARVKSNSVLLSLQLIPDCAQRSLFEIDFRGSGVFDWGVGGDLIVPEAYGPVEVILGDVGVGEEMPELGDVPAHEALGGVLAFLQCRLLLHRNKYSGSL